MGLVDLRGRQDEPEIRALFARARGSTASAQRAVERYRSGDWVLIGWEEDGELAACAGVERDGEELHVHSLAVAENRSRRGVGRALIDALEHASTGTSALVAETDADAVGFYERCGFSVAGAPPRNGRARFLCSRPIEPRAATAEAVAAWSRETSDDPDEWSQANPAAGHCDVTALVVRDLLGGEILIAGVLRDGRRVERHAWNRLPSGLAVDLTREQFRAGETFEEPAVGEPLMRNPKRYELFARRVREALSAR